ncbi:hypothetical protein NRF20_39585 [Streptomyces sp. R-74717]
MVTLTHVERAWLCVSHNRTAVSIGSPDEADTERSQRAQGEGEFHMVATVRDVVSGDGVDPAKAAEDGLAVTEQQLGRSDNGSGRGDTGRRGVDLRRVRR